MYDGDIASVLITEQQLKDKVAELAKRVADDYQDVTGDLLLVGDRKSVV